MSQAAISDRKVPALVWLAPIAVAVWCGLIVNGWAYRARNQGRVLESLNLVLEVMLAPGLILLILWLALTPATWRRRALAVGLLIVSSLPIALLACGQPGAVVNPFSGFWDSLLTRVHFRELLSLSGLQAVLFVAFAVGGLRTMNHYLSRVVMHRWPLPARWKGTGSRAGMPDVGTRPDEGGFPSHDRPLTAAHWVGFVTWGAALAGIDLWQDYVGGYERCRPSLVSAGIIVLLAFLITWIASQFKWRWWSCCSLGLGLGLFSGWPFFTRWAVAFDSGFLPIEVAFQATAIGTSLFLLSIALGLLTLTHQMPRPLPQTRSTVPTVEVKDQAGSHVANPASRKSRLAIGRWAGGIGFGLLWLLGCGLAYWVPRNLDLVTLVSGKEIRFDDAWLVAQLRQANGGEDHLAIRPSERLVGLHGDPTWHYPAGYIERRRLFNLSSWGYQVSIGRLGQPWSSSIEVIRQRALAGEKFFLSIDEPTSDLNFLRPLMAAGVQVGASLDLQGERLPTDLAGVPGGYFQHFVNARVETAAWEQWLANGMGPRSFQRCQLPDRLPQNLTSTCRLIDCDVSPALFAEIATKQQRGRPVELCEIRATEPFAGDDQVRFLAAGGILAGRAPLANFVADDFPPIFQRYVWGNWSRWRLSVRELLRDPEVLQQVLEQQNAIPGFVKFDAAGQITSLTLTPSLDCSVDRTWNEFPHVTELRLDLTRCERDTRRLPSEAMVDDTYGFQVEAFPRLQRVVIGNVDGSELPPPMLTFLTDLFSQPNLREVVLDLPCADPIWKFLASQAQVRALTIDVSPLRRIARPQAEVMEGVSNLATMPHLQEVVILDWDLYDVFAGDIGQTLGVEPDEAPTAEVMAKIQATSAQRRAQTQMEWMQKIDAIAPQLKVEVKFVEPPGGTARPNSTE